MDAWRLYDRKGLKQDFKNQESLFFSSFLNEKNCKPDECILIDDSEDKENQITSFGIKYMRINSPDEVFKILTSDI